jgi:hypothetical protein
LLFPAKLKAVSGEVLGIGGCKLRAYRDEYCIEYHELWKSLMGLDMHLASLIPTAIFHCRFAHVAETEASNVQWMDSIMHIRANSADLPHVENHGTEGLDSGRIEQMLTAWDVKSFADLNPHGVLASSYEMYKMWSWTYKETDEEGNEIEVFKANSDAYVQYHKLIVGAICPGMVQQAEASEEIPAPDERLFSDLLYKIHISGRCSGDLASSMAVNIGDQQLAMRHTKAVFVLYPKNDAPMRLYYAYLASGRLLGAC